MDEELKELRDIIEEKAKEYGVDITGFYFGEYVFYPGRIGCFKRNGDWYLYQCDDRYLWTNFTGPFTLRGIIYACSIELNFSEHMREYKFSNEELEIYIRNHFHSFEEIDEKYKENKL